MSGFGERLSAGLQEHGPLCPGIDPHGSVLSSWGLPDSAAGAQRLGEAMIAASAGEAAIVKVQSAFFERFGSAGIAALEAVLHAGRDAGVLVILDAKRGDIGSTMAGYAQAYLDPSSPLSADALTVSPFLGLGSLDPAFELADRHGRGLFVLALTSNPDGPEVQHARTGESTVAASITAGVDARNAGRRPAPHGLVIGATVGPAIAGTGVDPDAFSGPILSPGYGAQGATAEDLAALFPRAWEESRLLVASSRQLLAAGPDISALREAIRSTRYDLQPPCD